MDGHPDVPQRPMFTPAPVSSVPAFTPPAPVKKPEKVTWWVVVLVLIIVGVGGAYWYTYKVANSPMTDFIPYQTQGTVTSVSQERMEIVVMSGSVEKTVMIDPTTKIEKIFLQKNASSTAEQEIPVEINLSDVQKGTLVTVSYQSERDSVLSGVSRVTFATDEDIDAYTKQSFQSLSADPSGYVKGEVVSIDLVKKELAYKAYTFITLNTEIDRVTFPDTISVSKIDSALRLAIAHARETITLQDIQQGQTIFIMIDRKSLSEKEITPLAFVVLEK